MQQLASILYFLPCIVSLLWLIIYCFRVKTLTQRLMTVLLALCIYYFTTYAFYISPWTDYRIMSVLDVLNVPVILTILAVDALFVSAHHSERLVRSRWQMVLFIPVFFISSANFLLYYIIGVDQASELYADFDRYGYLLPQHDSMINHLFMQLHVSLHRYVLLAYILFIFALSLESSRREGYRVGNVVRFFFRGAESNPTRVISLLNTTTLLLLMPLAGMGRSYLYNHSWLGIVLTLLLSVSLFLLFYVEYVIDSPTFTLRGLSHIQLAHGASGASGVSEVGSGLSGASTFDEAEEVLNMGRAGELAVAQHPELVSAVRKAFGADRVYLDVRLSIQSLAAQLSTNRTTLSLIIGQTYGMSFRQLVARSRIEEAKKYMLANPDAKQEVVALECGFGTAQAFNQKFKEVEGESPRIWLMKHSEG